MCVCVLFVACVPWCAVNKYGQSAFIWPFQMNRKTGVLHDNGSVHTLLVSPSLSISLPFGHLSLVWKKRSCIPCSAIIHSKLQRHFQFISMLLEHRYTLSVHFMPEICEKSGQFYRKLDKNHFSIE